MKQNKVHLSLHNLHMLQGIQYLNYKPENTITNMLDIASATQLRTESCITFNKYVCTYKWTLTTFENEL